MVKWTPYLKQSYPVAGTTFINRGVIVMISIVGVDLAKSVFQVSIANSCGKIEKRRKLTRSQFTQFLATSKISHIVMEGCSSAHHWARKAEGYGHRVSLLHATYVRAYVRRNKTDSADADALVRAAGDDELKPIQIRTEHQQALQSLHRIRSQWVKTKVASINEARGLCAEFGIVLPTGASSISKKLHGVIDQLPDPLQYCMAELVSQIGDYESKIKRVDRELGQLAVADPNGKRILNIAGIGTVTASALIGRVGNIHSFKRGREFASWLGLTPREHSSGRTRRVGSVSRQGDTYLRTMLIHGARSALLQAKRADRNDLPLTALQSWALALDKRLGHNKAAVALANKLARIVWAIWTKEQEFSGNHALSTS